jgi:flagellar FliL protein
MSTKDQIPTPSVSPTRSRRRWLVLVALFVALAGGGGAYWWSRQPLAAAGSTESDSATAAAHAAAPGSLLPLNTFTVNLADPGASRFLRVTVQLVLSGKDTAADVQHDTLAMTRIQSAVLELLTTQRSDTLITPEGKSALKKDIATRVSGTVGHEVSDVLFSDFVVQF